MAADRGGRGRDVPIAILGTGTGIMGHLGARLAKVEAGRVEVEVPFRPELSQQHGYFHAGVVATVMDSAAGYAGLSLMAPGSAVLSVEFKVNLLAPADGDLLRARGSVVRSGRTLAVCTFDADVRKDGRWTPCATGIQTLMCLPAKADGQGLVGRKVDRGHVQGVRPAGAHRGRVQARPIARELRHDAARSRAVLHHKDAGVRAPRSMRRRG